VRAPLPASRHHGEQSSVLASYVLPDIVLLVALN
jgi:hypothetical protein